MFSLLFKYPAAAFAHGHVVLLGAWPLWALGALLALLAAALGLPILLRARGTARRALGVRRLATLWLLEFLTAACVLVLLWQPAIAVPELKPQANIVAILVDDSRSMSLVDGGATREQQAIQALRLGLLPRLHGRFQTRLYRLDTRLTRVQGLDELGPPTAPATHIGAALDELATETASLPIGAIVLLSDGSDNTGGIDRGVIEALRRRRIPVHTVGFGALSISPDVEIEDVTVTARALAGSRVSARVRFTENGLNGAKTRLTVSDGGKLLSARDITLSGAGALRSEDILFNVGAAGAKTLQFTVEPLAGEANRLNNSMARLIDVEAAPRRILYFEGEPRWEYKFIRRAADDDPMVHLVSILRTTENKIYRQGIEDPNELAQGFPTRAEDLFTYQGLIIGSVDAGYFTPAQQALIRDFVSRRGGGLLMLGGRAALADGVWGGSLVAEALPVVLPDSRNTFHRDPATVSLTQAGAESVICRLLDDAQANARRWATLPYLMDYEDPGRAKPGAVVLAEMHYAGRTMPLLVTQRYGRGRSAVLATGGTWRWQMSLPLGDPTHDVFWQQLLRWLVAETPGPVQASVPAPILLDEPHVRLSADVRDRNYFPAPDARVSARVIGPGGAPRAVELAPVPGQPGRFAADWSAEAPGLYVAEVTAERGAQEVGRDVLTFERLDGIAESFHTEQNRELLKALAASTGGQYWRPDELARLAARIPYSAAGIAVEELGALWNMPAVFLVLLALRGAEWLLRRRWGVL